MQSKLVSSHLCGLKTMLSACSMPSNERPQLGHDRGGAGVGGVHVEPRARAGGRARRSAGSGSIAVDDVVPDRGDHARRAESRRAIGLERPRQRLGPQRVRVVGLDVPQQVEPVARELDRLVDRGVRLARGIDRERRARGGEALPRRPAAGGPLAGA